jgi:TetR/AcrR family transcriptional regulator, regulator of mycofactocin system
MNGDFGGGLREQKKALTRATIEARALERFLADGYEAVRLEDLCEECLVSTRTFFRYFTSKEDLVLGRLRSHLELASELFARRSPDEPLLMSLREVINETVSDYSADPQRELIRLRLVSTTPVLEAGLARVFAGFERLVRKFAAAQQNGDESERGPMLIAAAAVSAFRVGLQMWVQSDARADLAALINRNLDELTAGIGEFADGPA